MYNCLIMPGDLKVWDIFVNVRLYNLYQVISKYGIYLWMYNCIIMPGDLKVWNTFVNVQLHDYTGWSQSMEYICECTIAYLYRVISNYGIHLWMHNCTIIPCDLKVWNTFVNAQLRKYTGWSQITEYSCERTTAQLYRVPPKSVQLGNATRITAATILQDVSRFGLALRR